MKNRFWQTTAAMIIGVFTILVSTHLFVSAQEEAKESEEHVRALVGTWRVTVTPRNCQSGDPLAPAFPAILTFNTGGTMVGTSSLVSSAYGIWKRSQGRRNYSFATLSFRASPTGIPLGTRRIDQKIVLDEGGDAFTTSGTFTDSDTSGSAVASGCSSSTGTRFE